MIGSVGYGVYSLGGKYDMRKAKILRFLMYMHLLASIAAPFMAVSFANKYKRNDIGKAIDEA